MTAMKFGDYLHELLDENVVNPTQLAKALHCHPSLVHKWLRNEKTPPLASHYIGGIVQYLNLTATQGICLEECQIYSLKNPPTKVHKLKSMAENLLRPATSKDGISPPIANQPVYILPTDGGIIKGHENTVLASIQLLEQVQKLGRLEANTVYLTFQGSQSTFESSPLHVLWKGALRSVLMQGWDVCHLVRLEKNAPRSIHIVEDMLSYLGAPGSYNPYYFTPYGVMNPPYDLLIIPKVGTLILMTTEQTYYIDAAIYLPSQNHYLLWQRPDSILLGHFKQLMSQTRRLLTSYSANNARSSFFDAHALIERAPGNRYLMKDGLSDITRPSSFYEAGSSWLQAASIPDEGEAKSIERWQQRMQYFYKHIQKYVYRDMYPKRAIERLVQEGKYARDYRRLDSNFALSTIERLDHLNKIIHLLQTYPNYQIALIDEHEEGGILRNFWEVKGDHGVILETWCPEDNGQEREVVLTITEGTIAGAFQDYARSIWEKISPRNRDKDYVVWWLEQQINMI